MSRKYTKRNIDDKGENTSKKANKVNSKSEIFESEEDKEKNSQTHNDRKENGEIESEDDVEMYNQEENPSDLSQLLQGFGATLNKKMAAKSQRLEKYFQEAYATTSKRIMAVPRVQAGERRKLVEEYIHQMNEIFHQNEAEIEKIKQSEEKITKMMQQQIKILQQARNLIMQNSKTTKQLCELFYKGLEELEGKHIEDAASNIKVEMHKEMSHLQKKILMDSQQQEMLKVRTSLQSMFY